MFLNEMTSVGFLLGIELPEGYFEKFRQEGDLLEYTVDWPILNFKAFAKDVLKANKEVLKSHFLMKNR